MNTNNSTCNFIPKGNSMSECYNTCISDNTGDCVNYCNQTCSTCSDKTTCLWLKGKSNNNLNNTVNTFVYFTNCFAISEIPLLEAKNFLAFGKINSFVFDITDVVQEALLSNYK